MIDSSSKLRLVVWMVTYNHQNFIEQAIESVMRQKTNFSIKLFIGEDCSTDATQSLCLKLKNIYPNKINLILNETNLGSIKNALNIYDLCLQSGADYIAVLEGDDYWIDDRKLQQQVDFLDNNKDHTLLFTRFKVKRDVETDLTDDKNGKYFKGSDTSIVFDFDTFKTGWYGGFLTSMFRTSAFELNYILKYEYFRDIHLYTELLKKGKGACLNTFGAVYRIHDGGMYSSSTILDKAKTGSLCYKELYLKNKEIVTLKLKFRYFHRQYVKALVNDRRYFGAFLQTLIFVLIMKDLSFGKSETKHILKHIWIGKILKSWFFEKKSNKFHGSEIYWEQRYISNKNSGAGSYGRLAEYKAEILNAFVKDHYIESVIEYGCGDGNQLSLASYSNYLGFDVSLKAIELCRERFKNDNTKLFYNMNDDTYKKNRAELVLSLDVIYHLVEDEIFDAYMTRLFLSSTKYVIIYSSNYDDYFAEHVKCREFTEWIAKNVSENWTLKDHIKNRYPFDKNNPNHTSMADFYIYQNS